MDKTELVKRLEKAAMACAERTGVWGDAAAITDAISYINGARDDVLESGLTPVYAAMIASGCRAHQCQEVGDAINALKSTPAPKMYKRYHTASGYTYASTDTRGTVADRRKNFAGNHHEAPGGVGRRGSDGIRTYGRRSNDRARWTGEAAPVVEAIEDFASKVGGTVCPHRHVVTATRTFICDECDKATQPAQEAPQPKKPGLVEWVSKNIQHGAPLDIRDLKKFACELDARQGEK